MKLETLLFGRYDYALFSNYIPHRIWPHEKTHTGFFDHYHPEIHTGTPMIHRKLLQRGRHRMFSHNKGG